MAFRPEKWIVVIVGRWNRSILTPGRIGNKILELDDPQQLLVAVPLDGVSPYQVKHPRQSIVVSADESRLRIHVERQDYTSLAQAMAAGVKALEWLPETPVTAAGFNVNFHASEPVPNLALLLQSSVDARLSDLEYEVVARRVVRSVPFGDGRLNLTFSGEGDGSTFECNFHRASTNTNELKEWLRTPVEDVERTVTRLLETLELEIQETTNGTD